MISFHEKTHSQHYCWCDKIPHQRIWQVGCFNNSPVILAIPTGVGRIFSINKVCPELLNAACCLPPPFPTGVDRPPCHKESAELFGRRGGAIGDTKKCHVATHTNCGLFQTLISFRICFFHPSLNMMFFPRWAVGFHNSQDLEHVND